jgi:hypothetical protein
MKRFSVILGGILVFYCGAVFATKDKDIPPWMESVTVDGRSPYLVPKGATREMIGSQIIVESPNEFVARRLYEMEQYLEKRLSNIEKRQEDLEGEITSVKMRLRKLKAKDENEGVVIE